MLLMGAKIGSTGVLEIVEIPGESAVTAIKTLNAKVIASNDNTPFEAMKIAA